MLDLQFIKENAAAVRDNIAARGMVVNLDKVLDLIEERSKSLRSLEARRADRNENARAMQAQLEPVEREALIAEGKKLKAAITEQEARLNAIQSDLDSEARRIPNMAHPAAPLGKAEADNREVSRHLAPTRFAFPIRDHVAIGEALGILDFETATKVSGTKFYFLKNEGLLLELGLVRYALDKLRAHGFTLFGTPDIARSAIVEGIGFNPRGTETFVAVSKSRMPRASPMAT